MSERSEKPSELWENSFYCDGHCGAEMSIVSRSEEILIRRALEALGWLFIDDNEAYCPDCQKIAAKVAERLPTR